MRFVLRSVAVSALLCCLAHSLLAGQIATAAPAIDDSGAVRVQTTASRWAQRGWISAGLGAGTSWGERSLAGVVAGWYSAGPIAAGVRLGGAAAGQPFSDSPGASRNDEAVLIGARTGRNRAFLLAAIGVASVSSSSSFCNCAATEMAYSVEAHANFVFVGGGATMFGALGPRSVRYNAFALTLDVGWFGR